MTSRLSVALCDLGLGNLRSVQRSLELAGAEAKLDLAVTITRDPQVLLAADRVVVPGQGAFRDGSRALEGALGDALREVIAKDVPYLGICLGLQLLFDTSDEAPGCAGLGVLKGNVGRLAAGEGTNAVKIPHMGWNELERNERAPDILNSAMAESRWMYFVHSFHAIPAEKSLICATASHGANAVCAAISRGRLLATQFHPEKSQRAGIVLLSGFLRGE